MAASMAVALCGCGGLPGDYVDAFGVDSGRYGSSSCATGLQPSVFAIFGGDVPGDEPVEFRSVEVVDASFAPVEIFVVTTPSEATIGFGSKSLVSAEDGSDLVDQAWRDRAVLPSSSPTGTHAELVVLIPEPGIDEINYVHTFEITLAVGGDTSTFDWTSLQMVGTQEACDELSERLDTR
jgi:hypothetical protein